MLKVSMTPNQLMSSTTTLSSGFMPFSFSLVKPMSLLILKKNTNLLIITQTIIHFLICKYITFLISNNQFYMTNFKFDVIFTQILLLTQRVIHLWIWKYITLISNNHFYMKNFKFDVIITQGFMLTQHNCFNFQNE